MTNSFLNVYCKIYGRVQGVGFRAWTKKKAEEFFLTGWVKNCHDKTVECEVSGKKENINFFLTACKKGPILSLVNNIHIKEKAFKEFKSFNINYK